MKFNILKYIIQYIHKKIHHPKEKAHTYYQTFSIPLIPQTLVITSLLSVTLGMPAWTFHINGVIQYVYGILDLASFSSGPS
jgi:hypothetical protein